MKFIDEFRDGTLASGLAAAIRRAVRTDRTYRLMEFCGGHTHAIARYGLGDLLPPQVRMIHGPGCPVCVLPIGRIDMAIRLVLDAGAVVCSYGDPLRVPASHGLTLLKANAAQRRNGEVRMVYSAADALRLASARPDRQVVFFAIGFETSTPPTAVVIKQAQALRLTNFSVLCCHVLTPAAIGSLLDALEIRTAGEARIDGLVGPAHVSTIIGTRAYEFVPARYRKPVVVAGFEPLDVLQAILMLIQQINAGGAQVENQFTRAVTRDGNRKAQQLVDEVLERRDTFAWRGLGELPHSALRIRPAFAEFDAECRFSIAYRAVADHRGCECGEVLCGFKAPSDCRLFGSACCPENPVGACMVSSEGACAAHYVYQRTAATGTTAA